MGLRQATVALGLAAFTTVAVAQSTYQEAVQMMVDCTVIILDQNGHHGAGVVLDRHTILTAGHVVRDNTVTTLITSKGVEMEGVVGRSSEKSDLATVLVKEAPKCDIRLAKQMPPLYSTLWTVGFPLDAKVPIVTVGLYQGPPVNHQKYNMVATTQVWMGNSGGGQFFINKEGKIEVVGIVESILVASRTLVNYLSESVPLPQILEFLGEKK